MKLPNSIALQLFAICLFSGYATAQELREPGGDPLGAQLAQFTPDEYAWRLFLYMSHPARSGVAGVADPTKRLGQDSALPIVWETWALESGSLQNDAVPHSEVYKVDGSRPSPWDNLDRRQRTLLLDRNLERLTVLSNTTRPTARFDIKSPDNQEVRANRAMFEFIIEKKM